MNEFQRWFADSGDLIHRLNYALDESSVVFDVGGYRGDFAARINQRCGCRIHIFEPIGKFYDLIVKRFENVPNITVYPYGLAEIDKREKINIDGDASSIYKQGGKTEEIELREIGQVMSDLRIDKIDLIKINIEGGEFPLLNHCVKKNLVSKMGNIQVQFHTFVENAAIKRHEIRKNLQKTHKITYDYAFVWENWEKEGE